MSRTNDVNIAMQYAKSGVDGVHLMDSHKATIGWVVNTLAAEVERLEEEVDFYKRHSQQMTDVGNGLYQAIVARLEPHFPAGSRDLEWDALPGTLGALAKRAEAAEARVKELEAQNARLRATLERLDALYISEFDHEDRPPRPQWLQAALNSEEAST